MSSMQNQHGQATTNGVTVDWTFVPSLGRRPVSLHERKACLLSLIRPPAHRVIKRIEPHRRWSVYFIFLPDGPLRAQHHFTLQRLRTLQRKLLVICACPQAADIPPELAQYADAMYWKALPGYDFSAYKLALHAIAKHSPGADVFVMNDSVYGPLTDVKRMIDAPPWDFTGFTASSQIENHIQSYAFVMKDVTETRLRGLRSVFLPCMAFSRAFDVIEYQETRLARIAASSMSVGAYLFADARQVEDPTLIAPLTMLDAGLPFLKKSLFGKHARFGDQDALRTVLQTHGHPLD